MQLPLCNDCEPVCFVCFSSFVCLHCKFSGTHHEIVQDCRDGKKLNGGYNATMMHSNTRHKHQHQRQERKANHCTRVPQLHWLIRVVPPMQLLQQFVPLSHWALCQNGCTSNCCSSDLQNHHSTLSSSRLAIRNRQLQEAKLSLTSQKFFHLIRLALRSSTTFRLPTLLCNHVRCCGMRWHCGGQG